MSHLYPDIWYMGSTWMVYSMQELEEECQILKKEYAKQPNMEPKFSVGLLFEAGSAHEKIERAVGEEFRYGLSLDARCVSLDIAHLRRTYFLERAGGTFRIALPKTTECTIIPEARFITPFVFWKEKGVFVYQSAPEDPPQKDLTRFINSQS